MFPILDLIAGLIFIFFLLAVINNSLFEIISAFFRLRAYMLGEWLKATFSNPVGARSMAVALMDHPTLAGLTKKGSSPAYMNAKSFAPALIEIVFTHVHPPGTPYTAENIKKAIQDTDVLPKELKNTFLLFIEKTHAAQAAAKAANSAINEIEHLETQIANWFDTVMERLGGRFKRHVLIFTTIFASIITIGMNVDSISIANYLYSNPEARGKWAASAYAATEDSTAIAQVNAIIEKNKSAATNDSTKKEIEKQNTSLETVVKEIKQNNTVAQENMAMLNANLPIGWNDQAKAEFCEHPGKKIGGWVLTILAICLGAPFWFDVLGKVANIRSSLQPKK